ncbi:MAG: hypothetical protein NC827_09475 [Candidatus Omnitrophica bacterium]|nr:hypothetical protein [Candidatus Omnitrophota bacterium]MCM8803513.1 hypothetical protein [Candidatus Omnitrophota bacterium]
MEDKKVIGETYKEGKPKKPLKWKKFENRDEIINFIKVSERYWFGEGYGSEKRKAPA